VPNFQDQLHELFHRLDKGSMTPMLNALPSQQHELARLSRSCRHLNVQLFERCCEFQRDPNPERLELLGCILSDLKLLEQKCARLEQR